jgi:histidinol-phosphate/aromatic aminotransferase/cobyric acid decarboxylase-like protein
VLGSLTKLLACPGLRAGYVLCGDRALLDRLRRRQPQWSVNGLVCDALPELLATVDLAGWAAGTAARRDRLAAVLRAHGYEPRRSQANWLLIDAADLRERLARRGILVRDCTSFGLPGVVRIAVPTDDGLERLERALA